MPPRRPRIELPRKLLLLFLLTSIVPLLVMGGVSYDTSSSVVAEQVEEYTAERVERQKNYVDRLLGELESIIVNISSEDDIISLLQAGSGADESYTRLAVNAKIGYVLSGYSANLEGLVSIDIFTVGGAQYHVGDTLDANEIREDVKLSIFAEAAKTDRLIHWTGIEDNINSSSKHAKVITAVKQLRKFDPGTLRERPVAYLVVNYDVDSLYREMALEELGRGELMMIIDTRGRIVFHSQPANIGRQVNPDFRLRLASGPDAFVHRTGGDELFVTYSESAKTGWLVTSLVPVAALTAPAGRIRDITILVVGVCIAVILLCALWFARRVVHPIRRITEVFRDIQAGTVDWSERLEDNPKSEVGDLVRLFNSFLDSLQAKRRAEEELLRSRDAAEAASRAKGEFLANMSHEIRTPLNGIMGMTHLALDTELNSEQLEYITTIHDSSQDLLMLINDILDFSKVEAGRLDLVAGELRLRDKLSDTLRPLALRAHQQGLELIQRVDPEVPEVVMGDGARLGQVMLNLVGNAIKFTRRGEIMVRVAVESATSDEWVLHFTVRDTGIGIPEDKRAVIFDVFAQADTSTTRLYGGTGLGLAISSRLATMMGGRIWVDSQVGGGSTFHFTARFGHLPDGHARPGTSESRPMSLRDLTALVADDNDSARMVLAEILSRWGMRATAVASSRDALDRLRHAGELGEPFDVALIDARMPDLDGFAVAEAINRKAGLARHTVMVLTADNQNVDMARCAKVGVDAYLLKPIRQSELLHTLVSLFGTGARSPQLSAVPAPSEPEPARGLRILLCEDNALNRRVAVSMLQKHGHSVDIAEHGQQALDMLDARPGAYDLVLMDVQMPVLDGLSATSTIRERERQTGRGHLPIVALTAHALKGDEERCLDAGMDGYISKPIRPQQLYDMIAHLRTSAA